MSTRITTPPPLPPRPKAGHKGLFGRVLVVGGSEAMVGAPVLAGTAALRMGAGLVQICVPKSIMAAALSITPELIGVTMGDVRMPEGARADAMVVGPGMGTRFGAKMKMAHLVGMDKPMVLDADALNILATRTSWPRKFKPLAVLTPHPGEMKRLGKLLGITNIPDDDEGRIEVAVSAAKSFGQVMVLKGDRTVVTDGTRVYVNDTGNSALSKAGSGDVLSGILGCLLGQKMDRFDAAVAAVRIHGLAGEVAGERLGLRSVLARDVIDALPEAIALYEKREL